MKIPNFNSNPFSFFKKNESQENDSSDKKDDSWDSGQQPSWPKDAMHSWYANKADSGQKPPDAGAQSGFGFGAAGNPFSGGNTPMKMPDFNSNPFSFFQNNESQAQDSSDSTNNSSDSSDNSSDSSVQQAEQNNVTQSGNSNNANSGQSLADAAAQSGIDFGAAVNSNSLSSNSKYAETVAGQFNSVTAENEMKWDTIEPSQGQYNFGPADQIVDFASENGMNVRGHTLVWHNQLPNWAQNLKGEELGSAMEDHITETVGHFKGKVKAWDVVNEAVDVSGGEDGYRRSPFYNELGKDYITRAFKAARAADPDAELVINDFNVAGMNAKSDKLYEIVKELKAEGLVDAVGIQGHFSAQDGNPPSPDEIKQNLQRFSDLGVDIHITELDVGQRGGSEEQKQQYYDYVEAFTSNPAVTSITTWGVGDSDSWRSEESPLLFDGNYDPKPAYDGVLEALSS